MVSSTEIPTAVAMSTAICACWFSSAPQYAHGVEGQECIPIAGYRRKTLRTLEEAFDLRTHNNA